MKSKQKFSFSTEFQLEILRYLIRDREGILAMSRLKPNYLTLIEHNIIAEGIYKFHKKHKRIPSEAILKETIKDLLESKNYVELVTKDDVPNIYRLISDLYKNPLKDSEVIKKKIWDFSTYIEMKNINESFDLDDFSQYEIYSKKINEILSHSNPKKEEEPLYMVSGVSDRQLLRQSDPGVIPCPFKQLNELTNGGGYPMGSVIVMLDKAKAKKTFTMVNWARGYLRQKKNVLYIDTENGQNQIMGRMVQSTLNKTKREMMSGDFDDLEKRHMRKYARLGVEFIVRKLPAGIADCNSIRDLIHDIKQKKGININVIILDYAGKLAAISKERDDFKRIHEVYVDIENLAFEENIDAVITSHHVTREAAKHKETKYEEGDISGAINIVRNAQVILGLNSTKEEEEHNIQRMEIVVQRDGIPSGRALFNIDVERQRMVEFTRDQRKAYDETIAPTLDGKEDTKKKGNPNKREIDPNKKGDI